MSENSPMFVVKTEVPPGKFSSHLNTQYGLGYELETMVPDKEHLLFTLMFRRRSADASAMADFDFEKALAALSDPDPAATEEVLEDVATRLEATSCAAPDVTNFDAD